MVVGFYLVLWLILFADVLGLGFMFCVLFMWFLCLWICLWLCLFVVLLMWIGSWI